MITVRDYRTSDAEALAWLFTASIHGLAMEHYDASQCDAWAPQPPDVDEWRSRFVDLQTVVAEGGTRADGGRSSLGFLSYEADGHMEFLYTAPRSARRGVASALLTVVTARLRAAGVTELRTEASLVASPFFARHGFVVVEEQKVVRRGVEFRRHAMHKAL